MSTEWALFKSNAYGDVNDPYLKRLTLIGTPLFSIKFHRIFRPDRQEDLHDHPWNFLSVILNGYYLEKLEGDIHKWRNWFSYHKAEDFHRISFVSKSPIYTLLFCGKRKRDWGFKISGTGEWVQWEEYDKLHSA